MKIKVIILLLISVAAFSGCDDKLGPLADFSAPMSPYVEITSKADLKVVEGNSATIAVRLRSAIQEAVTVNYAVSGAFTTTGSIVIPKGALTANAVVAVPSSLVPANESSAVATFAITSATQGTTNLTVGHLGADKEKRTLVIVKNIISFSGEEVTVTEKIGGINIEIPLIIASALKSATSLSYTVVPIAGNTAGNIELVSPNPIVIAAGSKTAKIIIKVNDNLEVNTNNSYEVKLVSAAAPAGSEVYVDNGIYTVSVIDDNKQVGFTLTNTPIDVTVAGNRNFEVKLDVPSSASITVPYTITGGIVGVDYIDRTMGSITFNAGSTVSNVNIDIPITYTAGKTLKIILGAISSADKEVALGANKEIVLSLK